MDLATLTFSALNERIDALPDHESLAIAPTKREMWGYVVGFGAWFIGLVAAKVLPSSTTTAAFAATMLVVEVVALAIAVIPRRPWRFSTFASERRDFAAQLDFDQGHHDQLIKWLSTFPKERLEAMAEYASQRHERLKDKYPLIAGGLEKLGALPVVAALYLQFKDLRWPPTLTWPELILGLALIGLYWGSLLLASVRFRAQLFSVLLTQAAESAKAPTQPDSVAECSPVSELARA
jgi:hypothetical protein